VNILILSNSFLNNSKESAEITITGYVQELEKRGHTISFIPEKGILKTVQKARRIKKEKNIDFDVIHGFSAAPLLAAKVILAKFIVSKKAKTVQTLKSYSKHFFGSLYFSFFLNFPDKITVSTQEFKQKLVRHGCRSKKIDITRSHIDLTRFIPLNKEELKEKYGFDGKKIIFYYGSFYRSKGVPELLKASQKIVQDNSDTIILLCPRHSVDQEILELVQSLNIQKQVQFVTDNVNIVEYLNLADVLVLPYTSMIGTEGNPSCLIEAAACKIPIVTSDFPELKEMFEPEKEVLMTHPGNVPELEAKIRQTLHDPIQAQKRAEQAFKRVNQFDITKIVSEFLNIYSSLNK